MKQIIFIRHGETKTNALGVLHKYKDKEKLNTKGINQMKKTAVELEKYKPEIVFSSEEKRSVKSAEIIASILQISHEILNGLEERNWGKLSGKPWSEIKLILDPMSLE